MIKKILLIFGLLLLVGCQPVQNKAPNSDGFVPDKVFEIKASSFNFEPSAITVNKGEKIRLIVHNEGVVHTFTLLEFGIDYRLKGLETTTFDFVANQSGTFSYYCSIAGHRSSGMEGILKVII